MSNSFSKRSKFAKPQKGRKIFKRTPYVEIKECYASQTSTAMSTAGTVTYLPITGNGTDVNARIGRQINYKALEVDIGANAAAASTLPAHGMWAVILDRQPDGALAAFGDIYDVTNGLVDGAFAHRNTYTYNERFSVLKQERFTFGPVVGGTSGLHWHEHIDLDKILSGNDWRANFKGTTGTISDSATNAILFVSCLSNQNTFGAAQAPLLTWNSKLKYTDP